jgi:hypothetical protein
MNRDNESHSNPIPIEASGHHRHRSGSLSSDSDSSGSPTSPLATPISSNPPKVATVSPSASPILSYFMSQSPTSKTFPFRRGTIGPIGGNGAVFEEEDNSELDHNTTKIHRRASTAWAGGDRYQAPPAAPIPDNRQERATGLLRRLSLSTSFGRPPIVTTGFSAGEQNQSTPPNTAYPKSPSPTNNGLLQPPRNLSPGKKVKRSPSPMGERILKGHFDGFN